MTVLEMIRRLPPREQRQQREFLGCEVEPATLARRAPRDKVDAQVMPMRTCVTSPARRSGSAQHAPGAARPVPEKGKRLDEIVVGARAEPHAQAIVDRIARGEHDHGRAALGAKGREQRNAVEPREHHIEDDRIIIACSCKMQPVLAIRRIVDRIALSPRPRRR